jgi:hypothetical protein
MIQRATGDIATRRELEVTWTHERAGKSISGGFLFRYRRFNVDLKKSLLGIKIMISPPIIQIRCFSGYTRNQMYKKTSGSM